MHGSWIEWTHESTGNPRTDIVWTHDWTESQSFQKYVVKRKRFIDMAELVNPKISRDCLLVSESMVGRKLHFTYGTIATSSRLSAIAS